MPDWLASLAQLLCGKAVQQMEQLQPVQLGAVLDMVRARATTVLGCWTWCACTQPLLCCCTWSARGFCVVWRCCARAEHV